ncbi:MAG TPA: hypothetical protein VGB24_22870 [Longimicrobium sp.]|jgi:hypothetical protein|uniref:hypothetical protein n=1 Tax=Longimicrobium sp. TaxID=2029185 RepID=UPI002ED903B5
MKNTSSLILISALLAGAACNRLDNFFPEPEAGRHVGIVEWSASNVQTFADPAMGVITAPDTVTAGEPFQVTITTTGPNGCWRSAGAEKAVLGNLATITPFDRVEGEVCTQALVRLPRSVEVRFDVRGEAAIRAYGRRVLDGNLNAATERTVEKRIIVR